MYLSYPELHAAGMVMDETNPVFSDILVCFIVHPAAISHTLDH